MDDRSKKKNVWEKGRKIDLYLECYEALFFFEKVKFGY